MPGSAAAGVVDYCNRGGKRACADALAALLRLVHLGSEGRGREDASHCQSRPGRGGSRLLDWLDPPAYAKVVSGSTRSAGWLADGLLVVTGTDEDLVEVPQGERQIHMRAAGVSLVDTRNWSIRTIDPGAAEVHVAGDVLLATGSSFDPVTRKGKGIGLVSYGLDGRRRFRLFDSRDVWIRQVYAGRAYVDVPVLKPPWSALRVVDLDTGRRIRGERAEPLPWLLLEVGSGRWDG
jgi:hypothetical protein